jgi:hypothetical protein
MVFVVVCTVDVYLVNSSLDKSQEMTACRIAAYE